MGALALVRTRCTPRGAFAAGVLAGMALMTKINVGALALLGLLGVCALRCPRAVRAAVAVGSLGAVAWLVRDMPFPERAVQFLGPLALTSFVALREPPGPASVRVLLSALAGCGCLCLLVLAPFAAAMGVAPLLEAVVGEPLRFSRLIAYDSPVLRLGPVPTLGAACWVGALSLPSLAPRRRALVILAALAASSPAILDLLGVTPGATAGLRFLLVPALSVAIALQRLVGTGDPRLLGEALAAAFLHCQVYPSHGPMHLAWALVLAWALIGGAARANRRPVLWVLPLALLAAQVESGVASFLRTEWAPLPGPRGKIMVPRAQAEELAAVVDRTRGADSVLDLTSGCLVAFLAERPCPLRHAYFWRGFLTEQDQTREVSILTRAPPPMAVRRSIGRAQFRWDTISRYAPVLASWVDSHYVPTDRFGAYELLVWQP